jgi:hypothetical protein
MIVAFCRQFASQTNALLLASATFHTLLLFRIKISIRITKKKYVFRNLKHFWLYSVYVFPYLLVCSYFLFLCHPRFLPYGFYGTFRSAVFQFLFLCLSLLQVVRRGSGALSPTTHAHSTSHSQTYTTTFIHPWAPFPTGLEPVLTSR